MVPCAERIRFNSVGSEAVHAAWRLARGVHRPRRRSSSSRATTTAGSTRLSTACTRRSTRPARRTRRCRSRARAGQTPGGAEALVVAPWNDLDALGRLLERHEGEIAAVTLEPVLCNTGCIAPLPGYLEDVQRLCREHGALLIFDEVITGFRLAPGGAQE